MSRTLLIVIFSAFVFACSPPPTSNTKVTEPETSEFSVLFGGTNVGEMIVEQEGNKINVDFGFSNNGRGASSAESITLSSSGVPINWTITGKTTFGNEVDEQFVVSEGKATWRSAAGEGSAPFTDGALYIAQNASPFAAYLYAKYLLDEGTKSTSVLPAGTVNIAPLQTLDVTGSADIGSVDLYALGGIDLNPTYLLIDDQDHFFGIASPRFSVIKKGFESEDQRLREIAAQLNAERFEKIAQRYTKQFTNPIRINNVRIFNPDTLELTDLKSVLVEGNTISKVEAVVAIPNDHEVTIEGDGGTLVPGLYEMHGHIGDDDALFNVLAGVTSMRDMGNEIDVLASLEEKIKSGKLIGPRIIKSGFIEGVSEYSAATGELAETKEQALALIRDYAEKEGYWQIKIYNSMNSEWVPDMVREAHRLGLRVAGHVPAFSTADDMIEAGYDELTHINQVMLGWVLSPEEDTRTLFRITGMKRFVGLDLDSDKVQRTLDSMVSKNIALDPTTVIHEFGLTARNGETRAGVVDYINNMPISVQRNAKVALLNVQDELEDKAYLTAYEKVLETLSLMHEKGILLVPGTDLGGAFELHRELELFNQIGMSPAQAVKRGSYDMAKYLGQEAMLGSIEEGKLADFFLIPGDPTEQVKAIKTISMVLSDGKVYFPSQIYPEFGITPFTSIPKVTIAGKAEQR